MGAGRQAFIAFTALLLATPGAARAAGDLDCMALSYDAQELQEIASLSAEFSMADDSEGSSSKQLVQIAFAAVNACVAENAWPEEASYYASLFELGRLMEAAYRKTGGLTEEQLERLDAAVAAREQPELWALMERGVVAGIQGREADFTEEESVQLGYFVVSNGIGNDEATGEKVGVLMGTLALQRMGRREFNAIMGQE